MQGSYNDISEDLDPRGALLISNTFADGKFGALISAAYTKRKLLDEGASTVRWQDSRNTDGSRNLALSSVPLRRLHGRADDRAALNNAFRPRLPPLRLYGMEQNGSA